MTKRWSAIGAMVLVVAMNAAMGAQIHVSVGGNDANTGAAGSPVRTLRAARDRVRGVLRDAKQTGPIEVVVGDGVHYLDEALVLGPEDGGAAERPVVYRAAREGAAVISGGRRLELRWEPFRDGILKAQTPSGLEIDQLFVGGKRQRMARYPNFDPARPTAAYQGFSADAFSPERAARWADPAGAFIHAMHVARWGGYHYRITGKNPDGTVRYEGGWQNNRQMGMHKDQRMVENVFEELDAPGEWFHDAKAGVLYWMPEAGTDAAKAVVEVVRLRHLIELRGTRETPVRHVSLSGFVFRHAARTFMDTREPLLRSDWTIYRGGAVVLEGTEDVKVVDCEFDQVGGNAIFVSKYNRRALVRGCHIHDAGASGVSFVGDPGAVRDPLFEYGQSQDLAKIDRTPGPKTEDYPADSAVEDCLIHGIGRVERQPAGVQIAMARRIAVRDTSIYDCARAGINIGDGTWGGHLIERVDVFDTVLETHDHGSFNSWGRDRFWDRRHRDVTGPAVKAEPGLPFLDAVETTVIRDSRWRCDHGWGIDLDDGSSNYDIYNNLMLNGGLKFREGYRRRAWNNVHVNNGLHPHVWFDDSGDEFFGNIVMKAHAGIRAPLDTARGKLIDRNLFYVADPAAREKYASVGWDRSSVVGDPLFVNPAAGDFRVREGSPAMGVGFVNFDMRQFGVKKPSLRAKAKQPRFGLRVPSAASKPATQAAPASRNWLGATLVDIEGEAFSAFGVSKDSGGLLVTQIEAGSAVAKAGLRRNDLLQMIDGRPVRKLADLEGVLKALAGERVQLTVIRDQLPVQIELAR